MAVAGVGAAAACLVLSGCAGGTARPAASALRGPNAYAMMPAEPASTPAIDMPIAPLDSLDIIVFQEPDLSAKALPVDTAGNVTLPLIGVMPAAGKIPAQLASEIETRLGERYLVRPRVSVNILSSPSRTITVQGAVTEPGVYELRARTTLLDAVAMAKGAQRTAKLSQVVIFRDIAGVQNAAVFDVGQIESGRLPNPVLQQHDIVVVGFSALKSGWREFLTAAPLIAIFRPFGI